MRPLFREGDIFKKYVQDMCFFMKDFSKTVKLNFLTPKYLIIFKTKFTQGFFLLKLKNFFNLKLNVKFLNGYKKMN